MHTREKGQNIRFFFCPLPSWKWQRRSQCMEKSPWQIIVCVRVEIMFVRSLCTCVWTRFVTGFLWLSLRPTVRSITNKRSNFHISETLKPLRKRNILRKLPQAGVTCIINYMSLCNERHILRVYLHIKNVKHFHML